MIRKNAITYIDLGMMGTLKEKNKKLLNDCIIKIIEEDYYEVSKILTLMCEKTGDVDMFKLKKDISTILTSSASSNLNEIDITKFVSDMFLMLKENNLILDKDVTMLIRGIIIIEATLSSLNPNLSLTSVLVNHIKSNNEKIIDKSKILEMGSSAIKNTKSLINIPNEVLTFFKTINNGDNKIKFEMSASNNAVDKIEKLLHELIIGIIDASLILSLSSEQNETLRIIIIVLIIILSVWLFMKMLFDHIHKGY